LLYLSVLTPQTDRSVCGIGASSDHRYLAITRASVFAADAGFTAVSGRIDPMTSVHPVLLEIRATAMTVYTDQEKFAVTGNPPDSKGGLLEIGSASIGSAQARYLYAALWQGPKAERADGEVRDLLQSLGWTVSGY